MSDFSIDLDDPYAMANLRPADTGLPMVVWVSERGNAPHDVRVKVCRVHGDTIQFDTAQFNNTASVGVRPQPRLVAGSLSPEDLRAVSQWIMLNADTLISYWDGVISTREMITRLLPLDPPIAP